MKQRNVEIKLHPRPELNQFEPYQGGLSVAQIKREYGIKQIIKMASNENPLGPSPKALAAYKKTAQGIFQYPESRSVDLRGMIAERFKLDISEVIIGAGSDEVIALLAKAFLTPDDEIVVSESSFLQYKAAAHLMGAKVIEVPMDGMKHDLKKMAEAVTPQTKFVFIANPNNPTGTYNGHSEVEGFLSLLPENAVPVFDEAYFEYAREESDDYPSIIEDYYGRRPMVVLRTFSKIFGLAGLRVGYGIAPDWCIHAMDKVRPPFNVSSPAQAAAQAALYDGAHVQKSIAMNKSEKEELTQSLSDMGFQVIPSVANFVLFNVRPMTGQALFNRLIRKGFIARSVDEYRLTDYLRVTVGKPSENKKFLKALKEVYEDK